MNKNKLYMTIKQTIKKLLLINILFATTIYTVQAQTAKEVFISMPDSILEVFSKNDRADFADFLDSKMKAVVRNKNGSNSEMTMLTDDYLNLDITSEVSWQMKLLQVNDSTKIVCCVETFKAPAKVSVVKFYTTSWKELKTADYITIPSTVDFVVGTEKENTLQEITMLLLSAQIITGSDELVFFFKPEEYMHETAVELVKGKIKEKLVYKWNKTRFEKKDEANSTAS